MIPDPFLKLTGGRALDIRFLLAALLMIVMLAHAQTDDRCLRVADVEAWDFLNIRALPDHESRIVGAIRPAHVEPLVLTGPCIPATVPPGSRWCPVIYYVTRNAVRQGYVKSRFTNPVDCPASLKFYRERHAPQ